MCLASPKAVILAFRDLATRLPQNEPVPETVVKTILFIRTVQKLNDSLTFREKQQRRAHRDDEMAISFRQKQQIEHNNIVEVP